VALASIINEYEHTWSRDGLLLRSYYFMIKICPIEPVQQTVHRPRGARCQVRRGPGSLASIINEHEDTVFLADSHAIILFHLQDLPD
jgi:hypothetical protein